MTQSSALAALFPSFVAWTMRFWSPGASEPWMGWIAASLLAATPVPGGHFISVLPLAGFPARATALGSAQGTTGERLGAEAFRLAPYQVPAGGRAAVAALLQQVSNAPGPPSIRVLLAQVGMRWYSLSDV